MKTRLVKPPLSIDGQKQAWLPLFMEFMQHIRIQSKDLKIDVDDPESGKLVPFGSQKMALEELCLGLDEGIRWFVFLKARQLGMTTITLAVDLFWMIMHPGLQGVIISDDDTNRNKNRTQLVAMLKSLPRSWKPKIVKDSRDQLVIRAGNRDSYMTHLTAGRKKGKEALGVGGGYNYVHATEVSRWGDSDGASNLAAALSERHPDRLYIFESTAHGYNHFQTTWQQCKTDSTKKGIFIGWWAKEDYRIERDNPLFDEYINLEISEQDRNDEITKSQLVSSQYGYRIEPEQIAWYRWYTRNRTNEGGSMEENYPWHEEEAFILSGSNYFNGPKLQDQMRVIAAPETRPIFTAFKYVLGDSFVGSVFNVEQLNPSKRNVTDEIELKIYEEPSPIGRYAIGCDPAYGRNDWKNNTAIEIWRCYADRMVQVAEYANHDIETYQAAWVLAHLAGSYTDSIMNYEVNGPGNAIRDEFKRVRMEMQTVVYKDAAEKLGIKHALNTARWYLYRRPDSATAAVGAYGFQTTPRTKHVIMSEMRDSHVLNRLTIRSPDLIQEMHSVIQDGDTIGAPGRQRDDRVFATALAHKAWLEKVRPDMLMKGQTFEMELKREAEMKMKGSETYETSIIRNFFRDQDQRRIEHARIARWRNPRFAARAMGRRMR